MRQDDVAVRCYEKVPLQGNAAGAVLHTARHCDKTLRQDTTPRQRKVLQQGNAAGDVLHTARHCGKTLRQGNERYYNKAMRQALCCIRQDTAKRHCGKTLWQGNAASAAERLSRRHCGFSCSKALRQNTAAGTTAKRHHDKTLQQKYTAALWQESATCVMALRHATATKPKKEEVGGGVHDILRVLVINLF